MLVQELIEKLKQYDNDIEVFVNNKNIFVGYSEYGYFDKGEYHIVNRQINLWEIKRLLGDNDCHKQVL